jgi:hypothetical protein
MCLSSYITLLGNRYLVTPSRILMLWTFRTFFVSRDKAAQGNLGKLISIDTLNEILNT